MEENKFVFTIPSYNRANKQVTVNYLHEIGIPKERIFVFVQTEKDKMDYEKNIGEKTNIVYRKADRVAEARNNILDEMSKCNDFIMLDDDIKCIGKLVAGKLEKINSAQSLDDIFSKCFNLCKKTTAVIFGVYPVYNDFYMEKSISTKTPINTVFGFPKGFSGRYNTNYDTKEDAELCARILANGKKILRFNFLAVEADHRKDKNGYIDAWHQEENIRCVKKLILDFPTIYKTQKNKPWEVRTIVKDSKILVR